MDVVDEFGRSDYNENKMRKTSTSTKEPTKADYLSFDHISYAVNNFVSNSAKNVSNYLTPDAQKAIDQLRQTFTKAPILQHFDPEQYIRVETDASGHAISGVLS